MASLATKYRPKTFDQITEQALTVSLVKTMCESKTLPNRNFLFIGSAGVGKAQPLNSKILTPNGFIQMKDVSIGTEVITGSGDTGKISGIYPQGVRPIYEIKLQDDTVIRVSDEHLNVVYRYNQDKQCREDFCLTTLDLIKLYNESRFKLRIDIPTIEHFSDKEYSLPIDPYLLGALIGDGSLSSGNFGFSNNEPDVITRVDNILKRDWNKTLNKCPGDNVDYTIDNIVKHTCRYKYHYKGELISTIDAMQNRLEDDGYPRIDGSTLLRICNGTATYYNNHYPELRNILSVEIDPDYRDYLQGDPLREALRNLGLLVKSTEKHIPKQYLLASFEDRLALLQGLYDTDGYTDSSGTTSYSTCSKQLSEDFAFLVRSLGIRDRISSSPARYKKGDRWIYTGSICYDHSIKAINDLIISTSDKHNARRYPHQNPPMRNIVSIDYVGDEECQCIMIDHPDHTYISDGFIPTHNTTIARIISNELNEGKGEPIELDAASHGSTDEIRQITSQASTFPVGMKYKIFIIDECFASNTWISTPSGDIQIKDINVGDRVFNLTGQATVTNVFKNRIKTNHLISLRVGNRDIITTKDHLFFTDYGWIPAYMLKQGDKLYDYSILQAMRETFRSRISQRSEDNMQQGMSEDLDAQSELRETFERISKRVSNMWEVLLHCEECKCNNLLSEVWKYLEETESQYGIEVGATFKTLAYIYMSSMWEADRSSKRQYTEVLQQQVSSKLEEGESCTQAHSDEVVRMVQNFIHCQLQRAQSENLLRSMSTSIDSRQGARENKCGGVNSNAQKQSDEQPREYSKNGSYQGTEWYITPSLCIAWWEWAFHNSANDVERGFRGRMDTRISCTYECTEDKQQSLSYELQTRPSVSGISTGNRGGWCEPFCEIESIVGRKESDLSSEFRVESVEIYQRGNNDELFRSSFTDTELSQDYVTMYDLEIDGHPSYFANGVLVHNCHALSNTAWQVFLKTLEEQPARSIFIFATTNPEKIPDTILSRVQPFKLSKISTKGIQNRLKYVIEQENKENQGITYDEDALNYIARLSNGGMRDSLTNLDRCLAFSKNITLSNVSQALDLPDYDTYFLLLNALVKKNNEHITKIVDEVYNSGTNFVKWFEGFHSFLCNIIKYIYMKDIGATMIPSQYAEKLSSYNEAHAAICLKLSNLLIHLNKDLRTTQYQVETAITYLLTPPKIAK